MWRLSEVKALSEGNDELSLPLSGLPYLFYVDLMLNIPSPCCIVSPRVDSSLVHHHLSLVCNGYII